jgi:hypothetical protein
MVLHFIIFSSSGSPKYVGAEFLMEAAENASWDVANVLGLENRMKSSKIFSNVICLQFYLIFLGQNTGAQHRQQSQDQDMPWIRN